MAIGNPLGLSSSVTGGLVSAVNREITTSDRKTYKVIQTDAAINSGNSGGALVNSEGKVIGLNTLKLSGDGIEGIGFAIPINDTKDIVAQLIEHNKVIRPFIGISGIAVDDAMAQKYNIVVGVYVQDIEDFSAAQKAGIKIGDVITEIDGQKVINMDEVTEIKNKHKIGDILKIKIYRNGEYKDLELTLEEKP
ncbi:MAG: PDZ domain-containing protein [Clostridia bacterium]|nr:PDZ domain-containing protein [Clostridia bacterium]